MAFTAFEEAKIASYKDYRGHRPAPAGFEDFWKKALAELDTLLLDTELVPAPLQVPYAELYDLYFTSVGGARIHCQFGRPISEGQHPAIAMYHGYHCDCGEWFSKLPYLAQGYVVIAMDVRGQGGRSEDTTVANGYNIYGQVIRGVPDGPEKLFYRSVFLDDVACTRILAGMDCVDAQRIGVTGMSQGGAQAIVAASLDTRVKAAAVMCPFLSDYAGVYQRGCVGTAYGEFDNYFRFYDPCHETEDAFFETLGYIDIKNLAGRMRAKTLWFTGLSDTTCPPYSQFAVYNQIVSEKEMVLYPEMGHEYFPGQDDRILQFFGEAL